MRLVGDMGEDARGYVYDVAFVDSELDFWELKFPAAQWPVDIALECSVCQTPEIVDQCEIEADVYVLAGYVLRFCSICGTSTEWRRAGRHVEIASVAKAGRQSAISPLNRRDAQEDRYSPPQHVQTPRSIHVEEVAELVGTRTMQTPALRHEFAASTTLADPASSLPRRLLPLTKRIAAVTFALGSVLPHAFAKPPPSKSSSATISPEGACRFVVASRMPSVRSSKVLILLAGISCHLRLRHHQAYRIPPSLRTVPLRHVRIAQKSCPKPRSRSNTIRSKRNQGSTGQRMVGSTSRKAPP